VSNFIIWCESTLSDNVNVVTKYLKELTLLQVNFVQNSLNCVCRFNRDTVGIAASCLRMTEGDLQMCVVTCEDGLLCEWQCNVNNKQLKTKPYSDHNSQQNDFIFQMPGCPNAVEAFHSSSRYNKTVKCRLILFSVHICIKPCEQSYLIK